MSSNLGKIFTDTLKLSPSDPAPVSQQACGNKALQFSFPADLAALNDQLRSETYVSGANAATEVDAAVLGRVLPLAAKFTSEEAVAHRHVVRWADQLQHELDVDNKVTFDLDLAAEREIKKKEKKEPKGDAKGDAKPGAKKDAKKDAKPESKKEATPAAPAPVSEATAAPKEKKQKAPKAPKAPKAQPVAAPPTPGRISLKVGFIKKAIPHPDADSLYVSTIDVGEEEPRTICSGLRNFVSLEQMQERYVVVVANLKPVKMRGIVSNGMVLCASTPDHTQVEFVNPPAGSQPGDKLFFEGFDEEPDAQLNPKKKVWEAIQPGFSTTDDYEVTYTKDDKTHKLVNKNGDVLKSSTIKQAFVS